MSICNARDVIQEKFNKTSSSFKVQMFLTLHSIARVVIMRIIAVKHYNIKLFGRYACICVLVLKKEKLVQNEYSLVYKLLL